VTQRAYLIVFLQIEFVKGEDNDFFMVIDGRHETITINFNNID